ncbi:homeobox-leucine zipper protein HOX27 isoform X2 [Cucumis sativus]|uniref:homeobox-leucine zipper protein HOX27 isoform X2 n=1 Tax=Cucumis sativus TaxID=3659 RepID=UPI0012F4E9DC|nr:homeobox-leucine zipper protein HOX27 isoform X2 [Cucumis sativus]
MELDLRLGNDPSPSSHPTPLRFSLSFPSIDLQHQAHNHIHQNHLLLHSLNSPPPPSAPASRPSSPTEGSGGGVFTEVISGASADGGGEIGGRSSKGIVWSIGKNNREEERKGKSENELEEEEEQEEMDMNMISSGRKKLRLSRQQSAFLEESFKEHHTLYPKQKLEVARRLNLRPRQVEVWFQNRRARIYVLYLTQNEVETK